MSEWAQDFYEIQEAVRENKEIRRRVNDLIESDDIHGKSTQGNDRVEDFRKIVSRFFQSEISLDEAISEVASELPRNESPHAGNNRAFADGWEERLVRTQVSRFYNQAVLQYLAKDGEDRCYVPHSSEEDHDSPCTQRLAGNEVDIDLLLDRLERAYSLGEYHDEVMIPDHPHCTHTVVPVSERK